MGRAVHNTLVIDQGTHASRAILYSASGERLDQVEAAVDLVRIDRERVEQDPRQILDSIRYVVTTLLARNPQPVGQAALATQRATVLAWERGSGRALSPALSWQDRRAADDLVPFEPEGAQIRRITGLPLSAHYGAGKLRWLLRTNRAVQKALRQGSLCLGPLASYLLCHLLPAAPHRLDHSNAHRTLLFDLAALDWSPPLLQLFGIPADTLPSLRPVQGEWGRLKGSGIPLTAVCGDQSAALFAQGEPPDGSAVVNLGTGAFVLLPVDTLARPAAGLLQGVATSDEKRCRYLMEGTVNGAGAALAWAQRQWPVENLFAVLDDWLAQIRSPPLFINTVGGLGSPWWSAGGSPRFTGPARIPVAARYVAIIESIVFLLQCNLDRLQPAHAITRLHLGGGLSRLEGLCQRLADLSGLPVLAQAQESTARGAAWLATGAPEWPDPVEGRGFTPGSNSALQARYAHFRAELKGLCGD